MQEQALERLRESRSGYLELPQQISTSDIVNSSTYLKFSIVHER